MGNSNGRYASTYAHACWSQFSKQVVEGVCTNGWASSGQSVSGTSHSKATLHSGSRKSKSNSDWKTAYTSLAFVWSTFKQSRISQILHHSRYNQVGIPIESFCLNAKVRLPEVSITDLRRCIPKQSSLSLGSWDPNCKPCTVGECSTLGWIEMGTFVKPNTVFPYRWHWIDARRRRVFLNIIHKLTSLRVP